MCKGGYILLVNLAESVARRSSIILKLFISDVVLIFQLNMRKSEITILGIILLSFIIGIYFYPQIPEKMASHWNAQGQVDGYMSKFWDYF